MNDNTLGLIIIVWWVHGAAVAQGFWETLGCIFLPPYAWVVSLQWIMEAVQ